MILINLLPHREAARKRRREMFQATMFASFLVGVLIAGGIYTWFQSMIEQQRERNGYLTSEIKVLEGRLRKLRRLKTKLRLCVHGKKRLKTCSLIVIFLCICSMS